MAVERISEKALHQILSGPTNPGTCIIKFYSNSCDLCHALSSYYKDISDEYQNDPKNENHYFFAFNIQDSPDLMDKIGVTGVPTIGLIQTGQKGAQLKLIEEPESPHDKTWYTVRHIKNFIDKEKI